MGVSFWICEDLGHEFEQGVCKHCGEAEPPKPVSTVKPGEIYHGFEDDDDHD